MSGQRLKRLSYLSCPLHGLLLSFSLLSGIVLSPSLFATELSGSELGEQHQHFAHATAVLLENASQLARLPSTLATDVAANLSRISDDPLSTCVRYAASVPEPASQRGGPEEASVKTRVAVAQLYAEVARWPPSERQRRMIRRLNNLNGGLIPQASRCVGYLQRRVADRQSVRVSALPFDLPPVFLLSFSSFVFFSGDFSDNRKHRIPSLTLSSARRSRPPQKAPPWSASVRPIRSLRRRT